MSPIQDNNVVTNYDVSLDDVVKLIARDLGVSDDLVKVTYVIGETGPGDPMDRFPAPTGVVGLRVTVTKEPK